MTAQVADIKVLQLRGTELRALLHPLRSAVTVARGVHAAGATLAAPADAASHFVRQTS